MGRRLFFSYRGGTCCADYPYGDPLYPAEKLRERKLEGGSDSLDVHQTDVAGAAFHVRKVSSVDAGGVGQRLLRQFQLLGSAYQQVSQF